MENSLQKKKLAHYGRSLRTEISSIPHESVPVKTSSNVELLDRILERLPESQKAQCEQFKSLLRNKSHSPSPVRTNRRAATLMPPAMETGRMRAYSGQDIEEMKQKASKIALYEVNLTGLVNLDNFVYNFYIGDQASANDCSLLVSRAIQGIVTVGPDANLINYPNVCHGYFCVPIREENFVWESMKIAYKPLDYMLTNGNTMIHCRDGNTYAPIIAIAYLMKKFNLLYTDAREKVCKEHTSILISSKFEHQLKQYERLSAL